MTFSVRVPALLATLCAFMALLVVATLGPMICKEINDAWLEFDQDMEQFKVISNDLWHEMIEMGKTQGLDRNRRFTGQRFRVRPTRPRGFAADSLLASPPSRTPIDFTRKPNNGPPSRTPFDFTRKPIIMENRDGGNRRRQQALQPPLPGGINDPPLPRRRGMAPGRRPDDYYDWQEDRRSRGRPFERAINSIGYENEEELPIPSRPPPPAPRTQFVLNDRFQPALPEDVLPPHGNPELFDARINDPREPDFSQRQQPSGRPDDYWDYQEDVRPNFQQVFLPDAPPGVAPPQQFDGTNPSCNCDKSLAKKCPAGLPGVQGPPGEEGWRGIPGPHGFTGKDAHDVHMQREKPEKCYTCPAGPAGPDGDAGEAGEIGLRGSSAEPGRHGSHGLPGRPGMRGEEGTAGPIGDAGRQGERGDCAVWGTVGVKGRKGNAGNEGTPGDTGRLGLDGPDGFTGDQGPAGTVGRSGAGGPGGAGTPGEPGRPGNDGVYCSCPKREFYNPGDEFIRDTRHDTPLIPDWKRNTLWKKKRA